MKIKPLFDRVIVECIQEQTTASGIFIGTESQEKPKTGKVLYVGEGNKTEDGKTIPMFVKVNDTILFNKFSAVEAVIDNKQVFILRQTDILAIID